jgi:hypothetical protein
MVRFNYSTGLLITDDQRFNLDDLRAYLLTYSRSLCDEHLIGTFYRPGVVVEDSTLVINGQLFKRREINLSGQIVNTYDWNTIFFKASKSGLIQNFINENSRNRNGSDETVTVQALP